MQTAETNKSEARSTSDSVVPPLSPAEKFPAIDALRAFAALAVVGCHCAVIGKWPPESTGWIARTLSYGWLGVDLFFVISGFVITRAALQLRQLSWADYARVFWIRRAARILPLYYVTLVAFLLLIDHRPVTADGAGKQIITHLLLIHQWWPETAGAINGVSWTLGVEILFYLIAWLLVGLRAVSPRRGAVFIASIVIATIAYRLGVFAQQPSEAGRIFWANQVFGLLDGFMFGTGIAMWRARAINAFQVESSHSRTTPIVFIVLGALTLAGCLVVLDMHRTDIWQTPLLVGGFRTFVAFAFALMVLGAVQWPRGIRVPAALRFLGDISYGIYLWHLILLLWWQSTFAMSGFLLAVATVLSTLAVATLTYFLIEAPCQRIGKRLTAVARNWMAAALNSHQ